jgi:polysaccharide pyruvyl transferase WcaK-like protein
MNATGATLFAPPATAHEIAGARAVAILVGGYDGSGNYGDIALLEAALRLVDRLGPGLLAVPLLERSLLEQHRQLAPDDEWAARAVFFDPEGVGEDGLVPVPAPAALAFGACYLYGGGYLNRSWGERKLAMLGAGEALLEAGGAGRICRVASGLQVEPEWTAPQAEDDASVLGSFDLLGTRDDASATALAALRPGSSVVRAVDDAVALLAAPAAASPAGPNGQLRVNLHFAEHAWASERPEAVLDFYTNLLAELVRLSERPLLAQPLIAYLDRRVDERPALERLGVVCADLGVEVAEPLLLRPASLAETGPRLRAADLTVSCSYHVALTSLMLEVPAVLLGDNAYYAQKAAGLAEDFGLPAAFRPSADDDPRAGAREITSAVLDSEDATGLRERIAAGATRLGRRRTAAEVELLGLLGGRALAAFDERASELERDARERAAEPALLHAELSELRTECETLRARENQSPLEAELRAQGAEASAAAAHAELASVLSSRSWRLLAPLRRLVGRPRPG